MPVSLQIHLSKYFFKIWTQLKGKFITLVKNIIIDKAFKKLKKKNNKNKDVTMVHRNIMVITES